MYSLRRCSRQHYVQNPLLFPMPEKRRHVTYKVAEPGWFTILESVILASASIGPNVTRTSSAPASQQAASMSDSALDRSCRMLRRFRMAATTLTLAGVARPASASAVD